MTMYEVIVVRYGTRDTVRSEVFLNHAFYGAEDAPITVDYFFWVLRSHQRTFIVDVGFSPRAGNKRNRQLLLDPLEAMRTLGIDPAADNDVIITHAHYDHIGNLEALPNSRLLMSQKEYDFWTSPLAGKELFRHFAEVHEIEHLRTARDQGRLRFVQHGDSPAPGVTLLEIGGHTPGQLAVIVETPEGPSLLTSDAVHFYEEMSRDMPFIAVCDLPQMYAGFETVRQLLATQPHHLVTGHDSSTLQRFPALPGPLAAHAVVIGRPPAPQEGQP
jgi:glyoxylase-like metal-dependent hydrolase (beta-lactamase superfamily II)